MRTLYLILMAVLLSAGLQSAAQSTTINHQNGIALEGYDVVAFFTDSMAVKGNANNAYTWQGVQWHFASQAHREAFAMNPERYAPSFGGFCAYGTARGYKAPTQIETWTIHEGRLFLNYSLKVKSLWLKEMQGYIEKANEQWPAIKDTKPAWQQ
jgi:YHS domain-containing protein